MRRTVIALLTVALATVSVTAAADTIIRVSGDTVGATKAGASGWAFNRDASTSTPFAFTLDQASIGYGSLHVLPIENVDGTGEPEPKDKFIAENLLGQPVADLGAIAYDFLVAGDGGATDANHFYLNVYATVDDSDEYYDCRFDYVPAAGSNDAFTTASFAVDDAPANVTRRGDRIEACPETLAGMPAGSHVRMFALNVGDTSSNDTGLGGYLDNVVVTMTNGGTTTYDFEVPIPVKDACRNGGYADYGFANQGECVSALQAGVSGGN